MWGVRRAAVCCQGDVVRRGGVEIAKLLEVGGGGR